MIKKNKKYKKTNIERQSERRKIKSNKRRKKSKHHKYRP